HPQYDGHHGQRGRASRTIRDAPDVALRRPEADMDITVRPLEERDLPEADRIFRLAFGTFVGLPDPMTFLGDADLIFSRWRAAPADAIAADVDGKLAGTMFVANWGSVGFFGPLTVRPDLWNK